MNEGTEKNEIKINVSEELFQRFLDKINPLLEKELINSDLYDLILADLAEAYEIKESSPKESLGLIKKAMNRVEIAAENKGEKIDFTDIFSGIPGEILENTDLAEHEEQRQSVFENALRYKPVEEEKGEPSSFGEPQKEISDAEIEEAPEPIIEDLPKGNNHEDINYFTQKANDLYYFEIKPKLMKGEVSAEIAKNILENLENAYDLDDNNPQKLEIIKTEVGRMKEILDQEIYFKPVKKEEEHKFEFEGKGVPLPYTDYSEFEKEIPEVLEPVIQNNLEPKHEFKKEGNIEKDIEESLNRMKELAREQEIHDALTEMKERARREEANEDFGEFRNYVRNTISDANSLISDLRKNLAEQNADISVMQDELENLYNNFALINSKDKKKLSEAETEINRQEQAIKSFKEDLKKIEGEIENLELKRYFYSELLLSSDPETLLLKFKEQKYMEADEVDLFLSYLKPQEEKKEVVVLEAAKKRKKEKEIDILRNEFNEKWLNLRAYIQKLVGGKENIQDIANIWNVLSNNFATHNERLINTTRVLSEAYKNSFLTKKEYDEVFLLIKETGAKLKQYESVKNVEESLNRAKFLAGAARQHEIQEEKDLTVNRKHKKLKRKPHGGKRPETGDEEEREKVLGLFDKPELEVVDWGLRDLRKEAINTKLHAIDIWDEARKSEEITEYGLEKAIEVLKTLNETKAINNKYRDKQFELLFERETESGYGRHLNSRSKLFKKLQETQGSEIRSLIEVDQPIKEKYERPSLAMKDALRKARNIKHTLKEHRFMGKKGLKKF